MAPAKKPPVTSDDVKGFKYLEDLHGLFARLRPDGCERDRAGNRTLFFDQYGSLLLLSMFSPVLDSLRGIQQASCLPKVQKLLGCSRASLGSLSEAARVFDPDLLAGIVAELGGQLSPVAGDPRLADLKDTLTLVDGTLLTALPRLVETLWKTKPDGSPHHAWRLHVQYDFATGVPGRVDLTPGKPAGENAERAVLRRSLVPGRCYVEDRGYVDFKLFDDIHAADSSYVCRLTDGIVFAQVVEERLLSDAALAAGVVRDAIVLLGNDPARRPTHPTRIVTFEYQARGLRVRRPGEPEVKDTLTVATDLLDLPAELIALIYKFRWQIELFFRFFKQMLGCRHLLSTDPDGIRIQVYVAIIACMLISLWTGKKPTKRTVEMIHFHLCGLATADDLLAHLTRLKEHD